MYHAMRLAVLGLIGYLIYDIISTSRRRSLKSAADKLSVHSEHHDRPSNITGATGEGAPTLFRDADGAARRQTVGRGVVRRA